MPPTKDSQRIQLRNLLDSRSMMRAQELREAGISAQTIARAVETGEIERISRGVYQKRGSKIEENQILAEAATISNLKVLRRDAFVPVEGVVLAKRSEIVSVADD